MNPLATSTDLVLTITKKLRQVGVVGKFVEFFGKGCADLTIADRATIANMSPEMGCTCCFFAPDSKVIDYLHQTARPAEQIARIEAYFRAQKFFRDASTNDMAAPVFSQVVQLDLSGVVPCVSGPKRPHDHVPLSEMKADFAACLRNKAGFKGFGIADDRLDAAVPFTFDGESFSLRHGDIVIAAITS